MLAVVPPAVGSWRPHLRVAGVCLGRFPLVDGRPQDEAWMAQAMVAHFEPGSVPLMSWHGGVPFGSVETLTADGADLHFSGSMLDYPDIIEQLRRGHGISIEIATGYPPPPDGRPRQDTHPRREAYPHWTGTLHIGPNLTGVALSERPAAPGSVMWLVRE